MSQKADIHKLCTKMTTYTKNMHNFRTLHLQ